MEYVPGGSLGQYLEKEDRLPLSMELTCRLGHQILVAICELESKKIAHRDIKPDNIMLTDENIAKANIKLIDFGLSRTYNMGNLMRTYVGTPLFMVRSGRLA